MAKIKIGIIGTDTSHAKVFTRIFNDPTHPNAVAWGTVTAAFPGGSPDLPLSINRVAGYVEELRDGYNVAIKDSIEEVADQCDAILLTSVDGRVHYEQFSQLAPFGKPVFIDKPLAVDPADAQRILELARSSGVPVMSCSVRRYAEDLTSELARFMEQGDNPVMGAECFGPIEYINQMPGWYWYGIHIVDPLIAVMGPGCRKVTVFRGNHQDVAVGEWNGGRLGIARANFLPNRSHGTVIHGSEQSVWIDTARDGMAKYAHLLNGLKQLFEEGIPAVSPVESLEVIRFMQAANDSMSSGHSVEL